MTMQKMTVPKARPLVMALLVAVALTAGSIACRGGADPPATATPPFSLPTALPSPEAVSTTAATEATAARTSDYLDRPQNLGTPGREQPGTGNSGTGSSALPARA